MAVSCWLLNNSMTTTGYSGTPLAKKLGIKEGFLMSVMNAPDHYFELFTDLPASVKIINDPRQKKDIIHFFVKEEKELLQQVASLKNGIRQNGMIWISWPKKASK